MDNTISVSETIAENVQTNVQISKPAKIRKPKVVKTFAESVKILEMSTNLAEFKERFAAVNSFATVYDSQVRTLRLKFVKGLSVQLLKSGLKKKDLSAEIGNYLAVSSEMSRHYLTCAVAANQHKISFEDITDVVKFAKTFTNQLNPMGDKITGADGFPIYVKKEEPKDLSDKEKHTLLVSRAARLVESLNKLNTEISELAAKLPKPKPNKNVKVSAEIRDRSFIKSLI